MVKKLYKYLRLEKLVLAYENALGGITNDDFTLQAFAQLYFGYWQRQAEFLLLLDKNDMIYLIQNRLTNPAPIIKKMAGCKQISDDDDLRNCCTAYVAGGFWYSYRRQKNFRRYGFIT